MCYSVAITQDSQPHFAFSFKSMQYTFTLLPMGYLNIPIIAYDLCRQDLNSLTLIHCHIWHYIDEIILWGLSEDAIQEDLHLVTQYLLQKKVSPTHTPPKDPRTGHWGQVISRKTSPNQVSQYIKADIVHSRSLHLLRQYILLKLIYAITCKSASLYWGNTQQTALWLDQQAT